MGNRRLSSIRRSFGLLMAATVLSCGSANALTLKEAIAVAVESNPEIGQAIENREAIEFELRQAKGLYLPSIDLEASAGARRLDNSVAPGARYRGRCSLSQRSRRRHHPETLRSTALAVPRCSARRRGSTARPFGCWSARSSSALSRGSGLSRISAAGRDRLRGEEEPRRPPVDPGRHPRRRRGRRADRCRPPAGRGAPLCSPVARDRSDRGTRGRQRSASSRRSASRSPIRSSRAPWPGAAGFAGRCHWPCAHNNPRVHMATATSTPLPPKSTQPAPSSVRRSWPKAARAPATTSTATSETPTISRPAWCCVGTSIAAVSTRPTSRNRSAAPASSG